MIAPILSLFLALSACGPRFATPYSAGQLAAEQKRPDKALLHYLAQPGADPAVCDLGRDGPHLTRADARVLSALEGAIQAGTLPAPAAAACALALWPHLSPAEATPLAHALLAAATDALLTGADADPWVHALLHRPPEPRLDPAAVRAASARLRASANPSPGAARLLEAIELEAGLLDGEPVDAARIAAESDPTRLLALARRLPDATLRDQAGQRLLAVRLAAAPHPSGLGKPTLLPDGGWPVPLNRHPVLRARWVAGREAPIAVRVQQLLNGGFRLVAAAPGATHAEAAVDLRAGLEIEVEGLSAPIRLCPGLDPWDPTPCLAPAALGVAEPWLRVSDGRLRIVEDPDLSALVAISRGGDRLEARVSAGGVAVDGLGFGLHFDAVPPLVYTPTIGTMRGPNLTVEAFEGSNDRLILTITRADTQARRAVVVPLSDLGFQVISRGAAGSPGSAGSSGVAGQTGSTGSPASCPYTTGGSGGPGTNGSPGGPGGDGGNGGDGGDVSVRLACDGCERVSSYLTPRVRSEGGAGGAGGAGGQGGAGGAGGQGGPGASCNDTDIVSGVNQSRSLSGGLNGPAGSAGSNGTAGRPGTNGKPGTVRFEPAP